MASYPDWVMKYKGPGLYVTKRKNGSYSIYRGHSERVKDKKYPVLKCDEYIGTITENEGLIPYLPSIKGEVRVYSYGLWALYDGVCGNLRKMPEHYKANGEIIFRRAYLTLINSANAISYEREWISVHNSAIPSLKELTEEENKLVLRLLKQMESRLRDSLKEDADEMIELAKSVYVVHVNERFILSSLPIRLINLLEKHKFAISFEGGENER